MEGNLIKGTWTSLDKAYMYSSYNLCRSTIVSKYSRKKKYIVSDYVP